MSAWMWLIGAITTEVGATLALKSSEGFSRVTPSILTAVGYGASFYCLSQALVRGMPLGIAYAVWSAVGVSALALIGVLVLSESLTWIQVGGIILIIGGVAAIQLGGA